jgi:phosphate transport system substrate-binding protein
MRALVATLLLLSLGMAQQAGPPKPNAKERADARMQQDVQRAIDNAAANSSAPVAPGAGLNSVSLPNAYDIEVSDVVKRFPAYLSKTPPFEGTLRITGASSMGQLLNSLATAYESIYPGVKVSVKQGGSSKGLAALRAGECDMAAMSRDLTPDEVKDLETNTGRKVFQVRIALDGVCIFVNADNPLPAITRDQLNGIFAITHSLTKEPILRWSDLDPKSPLGDAFMPLYMVPTTHGTMQDFMQWAMPEEQLQTILRNEEPGPSSVVNACCAYPAAIGISSYANRQPRARMVPVSEGLGKPAVAPDFRTIRDHSYPLTRSLNLVLLAPSESEVPPLQFDFLKFAWSESGQDTCATLGVVVANLDHPPQLLREVIGKKFSEAPAAK